MDGNVGRPGLFRPAPHLTCKMWVGLAYPALKILIVPALDVIASPYPTLFD